MKRLIATCTLAIAATTATAAFADDQYGIVIDERDFRTEESVKALYKRIRREARNTCPTYFVNRDMREIANCRSDVETDLVSKINHPLLNAYVEGTESLRLALAERKQRNERS